MTQVGVVTETKVPGFLPEERLVIKGPPQTEAFAAFHEYMTKNKEKYKQTLDDYSKFREILAYKPKITPAQLIKRTKLKEEMEKKREERRKLAKDVEDLKKRKIELEKTELEKAKLKKPEEKRIPGVVIRKPRTTKEREEAKYRKILELGPTEHILEMSAEELEKWKTEREKELRKIEIEEMELEREIREVMPAVKKPKKTKWTGKWTEYKDLCGEMGVTRKSGFPKPSTETIEGWIGDLKAQ